MNCNIIKDLLPLYVDNCCSKESEKLVAEHLDGCTRCRGDYENMCKSWSPQPEKLPDVKLRRIRPWKASILQSVMLFLSFALLAAGVIVEGNTPSGETNGLWAVALIVPATGYLLSLGNWFFIRSYKSRKRFSNGSCVATLIITGTGYVWAVVHYTDGIMLYSPLVWVGIGLSLVFCVLSKLLSNQYALLLGRE